MEHRSLALEKLAASGHKCGCCYPYYLGRPYSGFHYIEAYCEGPFVQGKAWGEDAIAGSVVSAPKPPITIADLEAKIKRMRSASKGETVVAAIDAIHAGRRRMLQWPEANNGLD